jgi:hypothetical protein
MKRLLRGKVVALACVLATVCSYFAIGAEPATPPEKANDAAGVPLAVARDRAKVMHDVYAATLEVMHDRYFHDERAIVPARALEDVFDEITRQSNVKARWISVNTKPMSIQHEPKSDFEKQAAAAIAEGKGELELVEKDFYRRAAPIPLTGGCVSCHTGFFAGAPKSPRFAALVISIPLAEE